MEAQESIRELEELLTASCRTIGIYFPSIKEGIEEALKKCFSEIGRSKDHLKAKNELQANLSSTGVDFCSPNMLEYVALKGMDELCRRGDFNPDCLATVLPYGLDIHTEQNFSFFTIAKNFIIASFLQHDDCSGKDPKKLDERIEFFMEAARANILYEMGDQDQEKIKLEVFLNILKECKEVAQSFHEKFVGSKASDVITSLKENRLYIEGNSPEIRSLNSTLENFQTFLSREDNQKWFKNILSFGEQGQDAGTLENDKIDVIAIIDSLKKDMQLSKSDPNDGLKIKLEARTAEEIIKDLKEILYSKIGPSKCQQIEATIQKSISNYFKDVGQGIPYGIVKDNFHNLLLATGADSNPEVSKYVALKVMQQLCLKSASYKIIVDFLSYGFNTRAEFDTSFFTIAKTYLMNSLKNTDCEETLDQKMEYCGRAIRQKITEIRGDESERANLLYLHDFLEECKKDIQSPHKNFADLSASKVLDLKQPEPPIKKDPKDLSSSMFENFLSFSRSESALQEEKITAALQEMVEGDTLKVIGVNPSPPVVGVKSIPPVIGIKPTPLVIEVLLKFIKNNPQINNLSLITIKLDIESLEKIVNSYSEMASIQTLKIENTLLKGEHLRALIQTEVPNVSLRNCRIDDKGAEILARAPNIESLDLKHNKIGKLGTGDLIKSRLKFLGLGANSRFDNDDIEDNLELFANSRIRVLDLSEIFLGGQVKYLVESRYLKELIAENCAVTDEDAEVLAESGLESIKLKGNQITIKGALKLANMDSLRYLDLSNNKITEEDAIEIAKIVAKNPELTIKLDPKFSSIIEGSLNDSEQEVPGQDNEEHNLGAQNRKGELAETNVSDESDSVLTGLDSEHIESSIKEYLSYIEHGSPSIVASFYLMMNLSEKGLDLSKSEMQEQVARKGMEELCCKGDLNYKLLATFLYYGLNAYKKLDPSFLETAQNYIIASFLQNPDCHTKDSAKLEEALKQQKDYFLSIAKIVDKLQDDKGENKELDKFVKLLEECKKAAQNFYELFAESRASDVIESLEKHGLHIKGDSPEILALNCKLEKFLSFLLREDNQEWFKNTWNPDVPNQEELPHSIVGKFESDSDIEKDFGVKSRGDYGVTSGLEDNLGSGENPVTDQLFVTTEVNVTGGLGFDTTNSES